MATIYKPPTPLPAAIGERPSVFLAGTIDNGQSEDWQAQAERALADLEAVILNPRRDAWDASWEQSIGNPDFRAQVEWELDGLEAAHVVFMYFAAGSKSPITLLELGLHARQGRVILVAAPGFWRRGNLEVVAARFGIPLFAELGAGLEELRRQLAEFVVTG